MPEDLIDRHGRSILAAGLVLLAALPFVLTAYELYIAATIISLALFGVAYDILYGYTGLLSFGHAVFYGFGGYVGALALAKLELGLVVSLLLALLVTGLVSLLIGAVIVRHESHNFAILTILIVLLVSMISNNMFTTITGGTDGITVPPPTVSVPLLGEWSFLDPVVAYYALLAVFGLSLALMLAVVRSRIGLVFEMIRENEKRAEMLGYNTMVYKTVAFTISGAFTGLAGTLHVFVSGHITTSIFSIPVSAEGLVVTVIGGKGTLVGPVLGAVLFEVAADQIQELTEAYSLFVGLILLGIVIFMPRGILGLVDRLRSRRSEPVARSARGESHE